MDRYIHVLSFCEFFLRTHLQTNKGKIILCSTVYDQCPHHQRTHNPQQIIGSFRKHHVPAGEKLQDASSGKREGTTQFGG